MVTHISIAWVGSSVVFVHTRVGIMLSVVQIATVIDGTTIDRRLSCISRVWVVSLISLVLVVDIVGTRLRRLEVLAGRWELIIWVTRAVVMLVGTRAHGDSSRRSGLGVAFVSVRMGVCVVGSVARR